MELDTGPTLGILRVGAVTLAATLPAFIAWSIVRRSHRSVIPTLLIASCLFLLDIITVCSPTLFGASGMTWAWSGKLCQLAVFGGIASKLGFPNVGIRLPNQRPTSWMAAAGIVGLLSALPTLEWGQSVPPPSTQVLAYQATMPGLAEELVYRGVLLSVLERRMPKGIDLFGVRWKSGAVLTSLWFAKGTEPIQPRPSEISS